MWEKFYKLIFDFAYRDENVRKVYPLRHEFLLDTAIQNINRLFELMLIMEVVELVLLILPQMSFNYKSASLFFVLTNAVLILWMNQVRLRHFKVSYRQLNVLQVLVISNILILATSLNLLSQNNVDFIHLYIVAITFITTGVHLSAAVLTLIVSISGVINLAGIAWLQNDKALLNTQLANIAIFIVIAWYLGILVNRTRILIWLQHKQEEANIALLEDLNQRDPMTRFYNHESIILHLKHEMELSHKTNQTLCLAIFDLDDFKKINDTYGHMEGDVVLLNVAKLIRNEVRSTDILGRYGGEEFMVIFPSTDMSQAQGVCERIRSKVESSAYAHGRVTISGGLAQYRHQNYDELIRLADNRMYMAKAKGKNNIQHKNND